MTLNGSVSEKFHELERRTLLEAMNNIPHVMSAPDSITIQDLQHVQAVFYDFFNYQLNVELSQKLVEKVILPDFSKNDFRLLLICMGFMSSSKILQTIRTSLESIKEKMPLPDYLLDELFSLIFRLNEVLSPEVFISQEERKEELARKILRIFNIRIVGETPAESKAILETMDSIEIHKLTSELEVRIRAEIQKKLDEEKALAAAKPSRE